MRGAHRVWFLFLCHLVSTKNEDSYSCELGGSAPRRELYYKGRSVELVLQESSRLQHKIMNAILGIILKEKYGYHRIQMKPLENNTFEEIKANFRPKSNSDNWDDHFPQGLINVAVDLPDVTPGYQYRMQAVGGTGTTYRHRLYAHPTPDAAGEDCALAQFYEFYADSGAVSKCFHKTKFLKSSDPEFDTGQICYDECKNENGSMCYVVLTAFEKEEQTEYFTRNLKNAKVKLTVMCLGDKFSTIVNHLKNREEIFFFIDDIHRTDFYQITTPLCTTSFEDDYQTCPFNIIRQTKYVWRHTYESYPLIYTTIQKFRINDSQLGRLILTYRSNTSAGIEAVACKWLQTIPHYTNSWVDKNKPEINLYVLYCEEDEYSTNILLGVSDFMNEYINSNSKTFTFKIVKQVFPCSLFAFSSSTKVIFDIIRADNYQKTAGIIVPAIPHSIDVITGLSSVLRTPIITIGPNGPSYADRQKYPFVFRTTGEKIHLKLAYGEFFKHYGWKRVAAISSHNQSNSDFINHLEDYFKTPEQYFKTVSTTGTSDIKKCLQELYSQEARIIMVDVDESLAEDLFLSAHDLGMLPTKGYVWVLPDWTHSFHYALNNMKNKSRSTNIKKVIDGHLSLTLPSIASDLENENENISDLRKLLIKEAEKHDETIELNSVGVGFVADAVLIMAHAIDNLLQNYRGAEDNLHTEFFVNILSSFISNITDFEGVSGKMEFYNGSVKKFLIEVKQWINRGQNSLPEIKGKIIVDAEKQKASWEIVEEKHDWRTENNQQPNDGSKYCLFERTSGFNPKCNNDLIITIICVILIIMILFSAISFISYKIHKKKMGNLLEVVSNTRSDLINRLHTFEVLRNSIELNWEIGKGSFGKVFGGFLKMDDDSWSEVAIKLLKCDASKEDENDFLYEAKTMASFNHKNIVKLMAVCTAGTPILIVMELMIHGDLKKFLITKRHLIDDPDCTQMKCISPQGLTKMALDVAMGLSYLASQKFIHRDIACRNCMVNAHGVVKLGDFGMTRYVFNKGEYLCLRKALFPVRWMAPESLSSGTYTTMSDIWSYGILLYEIITFGGTPYRNMKDPHHVKEFVIYGNIIRLPGTVNPQLKWLIEQCWSYDDSQRPTAADVVVYLANRPALLHACLESPMDNTQSEGSGGTPTILAHGSRDAADDTGTFTFDYPTVRQDSGYDDVLIPTKNICDHGILT